MLRCITADMVPRRLRPDKDMHLDLDTGITVNGTESHSMHFPSVHPTERSAAGPAEAQAPSGRGLIVGQVVVPTDP
jgi:hypothetical protein